MTKRERWKNTTSMRNQLPRRSRRLSRAAGLLSVVVLFPAIPTAFARILRTIPPPSATWNPLVPFTIGSGVEFETNREQTQIDFPMFVEYNYSDKLKFTVEPNFTYIAAKTKGVRTVGGFADLETSVEYEFLRERRYRPGLTILPGIKWPTATDPDIGSPGRDYLIGLIASKDLGFVDVDLAATYTSVGDPQEQDTLEVVLAADWHVNRRFDVEAEVVRTIGAGGGPRGAPGVDMTEGTLGVAWHISKRLKVEHGATLRSDGTWQLVWAWEFSFTGD